jgi:hypothetical protein
MKNKTSELESTISSSFILGGSPCSGKSTIAERLSKDFDLPYYKVDDHDMRHLEIANQKDHPTMVAYAKMNWDQIWSRPVDLQVREEFAFYKERFEMILDDLLNFENRVNIVMEGAAFLPSLVHSWGVPAHRTIFLVPTKEFQIEHYSKRPWIKSILNSCKNPQQAFSNWMERDYLFGQEIIRQAPRYNYRYIIIDENSKVDDLYSMVKKHFSLAQ